MGSGYCCLSDLYVYGAVIEPIGYKNKIRTGKAEDTKGAGSFHYCQPPSIVMICPVK